MASAFLGDVTSPAARHKIREISTDRMFSLAGSRRVH
jgi:hypothetical protein